MNIVFIVNTYEKERVKVSTENTGLLHSSRSEFQYPLYRHCRQLEFILIIA